MFSISDLVLRLYDIIDLMSKDIFSELFENKTPPVYKYFDGCNWVNSLSGKTIDIKSPVDGEIAGSVQQVTFAEIDRAIYRAKLAQKEWVHFPIRGRARILHLVADWLRIHEHFFSALLTREIGKAYAQSRDEVLKSADMIEYFADEGINKKGKESSGDAYPGHEQTKMAIIDEVPLGLVLAISPFNDPVYLSVSKIAPALISGNAVIFKPPTYGSIACLYLTRLFQKAGLPDGLLATLTGEGEIIGDYLVTHKDINMITFTGSSPVGMKIAQEAGMVPLLFECGGNNPALVLPDADMELTAIELVMGAFSFSGQRCTAIKYILCLSGTEEKLIPKVIRKTKELFRTGDPRIEINNIGPLINEEAAHTVEKKIIIAKAEGAKVVHGGKKEGLYIEPTILTDCRPSMEIVHTETFGPVLSFITVKSVDEAVSIINSSNYGLQTSIFTSDAKAGIHLARAIETGSVLINSKPQREPEHFPFLGIKESGMGTQGIRDTLNMMIRPKPIILDQFHRVT